MKRPKYHFFTLVQTPTGVSFRTLPGQSFGLNKVPEDILVKDKKGYNSLARLRKTAKPGDIFFTTTLRDEFGCVSVKDAFPLLGHGTVIYSDSQEAYDNYLKNLKK